jgi:hypothetical protein
MRRRTVLGWGIGAAGAAGAATLAGGSPAFAGSPAVATSSTLTAGPLSGGPRLREIAVQGTDLRLALLAGPAATVLVQVVRRFHYEIDGLGAGDVVADASGTAVDIRPGWYPPGVSGGFLPHQMIVIRDIVASGEGLVRWGGDLATPAEGRFSLTVRGSDPHLATLAARLDREAAAPGRGPGADMALPFTPARQKTADSVRRQMRS